GLHLMGSRFPGDSRSFPRFQVQTIELSLAVILYAGSKIGVPGPGIIAQKSIDIIMTRSEQPFGLFLPVPEIQLIISPLLAGDQQLCLSMEKIQIIVYADIIGILLLINDLGFPRTGVGQEKLQMILSAIQSIDHQPMAAGPCNPGNLLVAFAGY